MKNEQDYAIVIGIDSYPQLRRLRAAVGDAVRFSEWLLSPDGGGIDPQHMRLISSPPKNGSDAFNASPVQRDVDRALSDFGIAQNRRVGRRLYFYFAGHGLGPAFDDVGMLMADATMDRLGANIGLRKYLVLLHDTGMFDEVVFILDCCRDPERAVATGAPTFTLVPPVPPPQVEDFVVLAAAFGEKAFEVSPVGNSPEPRGVLTEALLEALGGKAANARGDVTALSLRDYIIRRIPQMSVHASLKQAPRIDRIPTRDMVFGARNLAAIATVSVRIVAPPGLTGDLVLRDGNANELSRRLAVDAEEGKMAWETALPRNARYEVEHTDTELTTIMDLRTMEGAAYVYRFPQPN